MKFKSPNKCKCGGYAKYSGSGMLDSYECTSCDYKTSTYFDGEPYAVQEWNKRNPVYLKENIPNEF